MSLFLICSIETTLFWTLFLIARYLISMCFNPPRVLLFLENQTTLLSQYILSGLIIESTCSLEIKFLNHIAWHVTSQHATYSASIVEVAINDCLWLFHEISPSNSIKNIARYRPFGIFIANIIKIRITTRKKWNNDAF